MAAGFGVGSAFAYFVMVVSVVWSAVSALALAARADPARPKESLRGIEFNTTDTQVPIKVVYGRRRVGINIVDIALSDANKDLWRPVDNRFLHIIGTLCEGEINGIVQVDGVDQIFLDNKLWSTYGNLVTYEIFTGSANQAICSTYAIWKDKWDSALPYTAYIYVRLEYDQSVFQSRPEIVVEIEGLKIYNPATEVTEFSNNPALCVYDFLTRSSRRGGMGISPSRIDTYSVMDAAAPCLVSRGISSRTWLFISGRC